MAKLRLILVTGRSLGQGESKDSGKFSRRYEEETAVCELDPQDLAVLGVAQGQNVSLTTEFGSIVLRVRASRQGPHPGVAFIPYGPWASRVTEPSTQGTGMPTTKGLPATVEPSDREVLDLRKLLRDGLAGGGGIGRGP